MTKKVEATEGSPEVVSKIALGALSLGAVEMTGGIMFALAGEKVVAEILVASGIITAFLGITTYAASPSRTSQRQ